MKRILGLDIGVSSVGLAILNDDRGIKTIENLSVRIVPENPDFHGRFYSGNTASKNLARTEKRGIRRNNQRFKARRDKLHEILKENDMLPSEELFKLDAKELYGLRAKAVVERISMQELGRVLLLLNQRRGFLSNRKSISKEENSSEYKEKIATLEKDLNGKTIGQKLYEELCLTKNTFDVLLRERTYQRKTYIEEFDRVWDCQKQYYPNLTGGSNEDENKATLYDLIRNKTIYYQRPLKSQKGLVSECLFEKHHKSVSKSSPYFELFRIWQKINDLSWKTPDGEIHYPSKEQKEKLKNALWIGEGLNSNHKLTVTKIKSILGYSSRAKLYLNFTELDGSRTYSLLKKALVEAEIENPEHYLFFNLDSHDEKGGLFELWHITYSLPTEIEVVNTLTKRFHFKTEQATKIAKNVGYKSDYGNLSTRAIRKLLPHFEEGLAYSEACDIVGYDHSGYKTQVVLKEKLEPISKNSLRNPVVEQILNQVVNMVNLAMDKYGKFDEIRVELARELRNSAKTRQNISSANKRNKANNHKIRKELKEVHGFKLVNGRDVKRYILWEETNQNCLYCNNPISGTDMLTGNADLEHILPKSRSFTNAMSNFIISHRECNTEKGQQTAYDFIKSKGEDSFQQYVEKVNALYADGKGSITKSKFDNLMCKGEDIPSDFVERMKKDSQYISKEAVKMLKSVCPNVYTTTGQVTNFLREEWKLKHVLQELGFEKYKSLGQTVKKQIKQGEGNIKEIEIIEDWSKRDDHRHHAVDALICALTDQKIIFKLNNLNKIYQYERNALDSNELKNIEEYLEGKFSFKEFSDQRGNVFESPIQSLRKQTKKYLEDILISFKKENSKVLTKNINRARNSMTQITWVPRSKLHEDTVMGKARRIAEKKLKLNGKFSLNLIENIVNPNIKKRVEEHLEKYDNNPMLAFASKTLKKDPIDYEDSELKEVTVFEWINTKRVNLNENITSAQISKIADKAVKEVIEKRILQSGGKIKEAFKNLSETPIKLKNGMSVKTVTVYDDSKVRKVRDGYVKTGGNHHALIYKDSEGKYYNKVISFWDAVGIGLTNVDINGKPYPIIERKDDAELGAFQFSMQINDLFVFDLKHADPPQEENEIDFFNRKNRKLLSDKLFRLQKMSKSGSGRFLVDFRHHLETTVNRSDLALKNITWITISKNSDLGRLTKIRIDHLGEIIKVGE